MVRPALGLFFAGEGAVEAVIETSGLSKRFRKRVAVHPIDLTVPRGSIFGYLGPNGAGKTTTIRMLLGLSRPTSGEAQLLGQPVPSGLGVVRKQIGSVLENPAFYPRLSARENLKIFATLASDRDAFVRISPLLDRVGLLDRADDDVRSYSHGMRQRLALAAAQLHEPELIVLDEPATALDPAGIRDVRALLASLRDEGKTIFISSHLLSEVGQFCDHICVVSKGRQMYQGPLSGLTTFFGAEYRWGIWPTLLTHEPRRGVVLAGKLLAVWVLVLTFFVVALGVVSGVDGMMRTLDDMTARGGPDIVKIAKQAGWAILSLEMYATIAASLALILRTTVGGIAALLVTLGDHLAVAKYHWLRNYLPTQQIASLLPMPEGVTSGYAWFPRITAGVRCKPAAEGGLEICEEILLRPPPQWRASLVLVTWAIGFALLAWAALRRRDVPQS